MLKRLPSNRAFQAMLLAAILIVAAWYMFFAGARFDRARWLEADPARSTRADMVDDLLRRYRLKGRSPRQVVDLLGPPTPTGKWADWELIYVLGPRRGLLPADREWLLIDVTSGRVTGLRVTHD